MNETTNDPNIKSKLHLACLDASIALKSIFHKFKTVVLTSGTLSPMNMYPRLLNFQPCNSISISMTSIRQSICPLIVTKGTDQTALTSRFSERSDPSVLRNYGQLIFDICSVVPDGVVCFFTSYRHLNLCIDLWHSQNTLNAIRKHKLLFCETKDSTETFLALQGYREACDNGRGACLFAVSRGKISEGVDFHNHYGRAVIVLGIPYVDPRSAKVQCRLDYLRKKFNISELDFLAFDALRQACQCLGRVIRGKTDYGIMILADRRFGRTDCIKRLPKWISESLDKAHSDLTIDDSVRLAKKYLKLMAQKVEVDSLIGKILYSENNIPL